VVNPEPLVPGRVPQHAMCCCTFARTYRRRWCVEGLEAKNTQLWRIYLAQHDLESGVAQVAATSTWPTLSRVTFAGTLRSSASTRAPRVGAMSNHGFDPPINDLLCDHSDATRPLRTDYPSMTGA
jgi:hypothetical protein